MTRSHREDLNLLKTLATALMPNVSLSHPITVIKQLCEDFIALSQSHFAILGSDADMEVERPSSYSHYQSSWCNAGLNSGIEPVSTRNATSLTSNLHDMCPNNEEEESAPFDLLFSNPLAVDFSDGFFNFDSC